MCVGVGWGAVGGGGEQVRVSGGVLQFRWPKAVYSLFLFFCCVFFSVRELASTVFDFLFFAL